MLKASHGYSFQLNGEQHSLSASGNSVILDDSTSWTGSSPVVHICCVYNTTWLFYIKTENPGYVLQLEGRKLREVARLDFSPTTVYGTPSHLLYNGNSNCYVYKLKTSRHTVKENYEVLGYDASAKSYILKSARIDSLVSFMECGSMRAYNNLCLDSVFSLPISWFLVLSEDRLVLVTTLVYSSTGKCTTLTIPVLGVVSDVMEEKEGVMGELLVSCDYLIQRELQDLRRLEEHCRSKSSFLLDTWCKLFDLPDNCSGNDRQVEEEQERVSKCPKKSPALDPQTDFLCDIPFQIPIRPNLSARTSVFLSDSKQYEVYGSGGSSRGLSSGEVAPLHTLQEEKWNVDKGQSLHETVRCLLREYLISNPESIVLDNLAHIAFLISNFKTE